MIIMTSIDQVHEQAYVIMSALDLVHTCLREGKIPTTFPPQNDPGIP